MKQLYISWCTHIRVIESYHHNWTQVQFAQWLKSQYVFLDCKLQRALLQYADYVTREHLPF